jgi:hypothetical protein
MRSFFKERFNDPFLTASSSEWKANSCNATLQKQWLPSEEIIQYQNIYQACNMENKLTTPLIHLIIFTQMYKMMFPL